MLTRIAPTPSGFLHQGNLFSFYLTRFVADRFVGKLLLRIDDLDNQRSRTAYLEDIFATLQLAGIDFETGPQNSNDFLANFSQRLRIHNYRAYIEKLIETGFVYACTCSRSQLALLAQAGFKRCNCRKQHTSLHTAGAALKIFVPDNTIITFADALLGTTSVSLFHSMGDFVIRRSDNVPAYQVASICDDLHYEVDYIVRGEDLVTSTAAQLFLAQLTKSTNLINCRFLHHPLIKDAAGNKLSKSAGKNRQTQSISCMGNATKIIADAKEKAELIGFSL